MTRDPLANARFVLRVLAITFISSVAFATAPSAADEPASPAAEEVKKTIPNERCFGCHDDDDAEDDNGGSIAVLAPQYGASAHRRLDCVTCHTSALETRRHPRNAYGPVSFDACMDCHEDEIEPFTDSVHARVRGGEPASCQGCHGELHYTLRSRDPNAPMSALNQLQNCGQCHKDMMEGYLGSVHAHALLVSGLNVAPACSDCHGTHDIRRHQDPKSNSSHEKSPKTCGNCHEGILKIWTESAHGKLWTEDKEGPVCTNCHQAHAVEDPTTVERRTDFPHECAECHEHPFEAFHDSFHGKAAHVGRKQAAICSDCHTPHHNLAASDPQSSVHPDNLAATCGSSNCHAGQVNDSFLTFNPHADPTDKEANPYLYWVWVFMTALLIGVFAFFGIHDVLWLQRALVGKLRGEYASHHSWAGPYVRRFTDKQIVVHITIVLSFLLLAITGLPLKFADASWSGSLMDLLGGPATAAWLHRVGAIVTFGYFGFHLLSVFVAMFINKERGFLWGWRSMVPQPRDIADLWANLKYFLYIGQRPSFDRWTYWEKFDYLAVFWGVAIIGFSGLMLWFPDFFTRFLPGWTLNAAYIVHSDEALLATGFIFLFHFFHTHLRPESFPMDPVIFTGSMPLEKFKEERPLEYERLVAENRLDSVLVDPPTARQLRRAYVFGFLALAVGIYLAVLIFRVLLSGDFHI